MSGFRMVWRGLAGTLEHLLAYTIYSMLWWLCVVTIILGPPATVALLVMTDPRRLDSQPDVREAIAAGRRAFARAWGLALISAPIILVLFLNIRYYANAGGFFAIFIPLWLLLSILGYGILISAFAIVGLIDSPVLTSLKQAVLLTAIRPFRVIVLIVLLTVLWLISAVLVVPLIMFMPAIIGAVLDRHVLDGFQIDIPDPMTPTDERRAEELVEKNVKKSRWSRN